MTFASCNKEDEAGTGDNSLKSVTISLANVLSGTRSAIPDGEGDLSETEINLINYQVFFSDGTNLYRGKKADDPQADAQNFFVVGGDVQVITDMMGNLIVNVKETRVAISKEMAAKIMV